MLKTDRYFYDPEGMRIVTNPHHKSIKPNWIEIKEGYVLSDGRTVVDDREDSIYRMMIAGLYKPDDNAPLTTVVLNPLIFL